jgi:hypothetical protein
MLREINGPKAVQQNGVALAGLQPKNTFEPDGSGFHFFTRFSATQCNSESAKRCVIRAFREFSANRDYRFYSRGVCACFGVRRASAVADF